MHLPDIEVWSFKLLVVIAVGCIWWEDTEEDPNKGNAIGYTQAISLPLKWIQVRTGSYGLFDASIVTYFD
jgi:hypothetical protein